MRTDRSQPGQAPADAYVELVSSLVATLVPVLIFTALFLVVAGTVAALVADVPLRALALAAALLSVARIALLAAQRGRLADPALDPTTAAWVERRFGIVYAGFSLALGLFGARAIAVAPVELHMAIAALLTGYAAGVALGIALRPRIGAVSMVLAIAPTVVTCVALGDVHHLLLALVLTALLAGGLNSMITRYRAELEKIGLRRLNGGLARRDHLTGLANRLGLAEHYARATADAAGSGLIALHCLDLDRFKPINDQFGHPVGDQLLRAVAGRIRGSLRAGDLAARVGGDEFVMLQVALNHPDEAALTARRLARRLGDAYGVGGRTITVGVSIGYAVSDCSERLDRMIARADNALCAIKRAGGGVAAHSDARIGKAQVSWKRPQPKARSAPRPDRRR